MIFLLKLLFDGVPFLLEDEINQFKSIEEEKALMRFRHHYDKAISQRNRMFPLSIEIFYKRFKVSGSRKDALKYTLDFIRK
jgi:hypothetical protein